MGIFNKKISLEEFFYLEKQAKKSFKNKKFDSSLKDYNKLFKSLEYVKNNTNEYHFKWYDEVLSDCLKRYSGDYDEFFKHLYIINIENFDAWFDKAMLYANNFQKNKAIDYCFKLLKIKPHDLSLLEFTGRTLCFADRYDESLEIFDIALDLDKTNKNIIQNKFYVYYTSDRIYDALSFCKNLKNIDDITSLDYQALGFKFEEKGDFETALWCYKKGFEIENLDIKELDSGSVDGIKRMLIKLSRDDYSCLKEFYLEWISKIGCKFDTNHCPKCRGNLTPIVYGYVMEDAIEKAEKGDIILGGCVIDEFSPTHYCKRCGVEFQFRTYGLKINYPFESREYHYVEKIIGKLTYFINENGNNIKIEKLKDLMKNYGLNDVEFNEIIDKLININYLNKYDEDFIKLYDKK